MELIILDRTDSTNSYARSLKDAPHGTVVYSRIQTAGRGQRGNSWEAEPDMNLTFSIVVRPQNIMAPRQFAISRASALAIVDVLRKYLPDAEASISVKWPNDIYVGDKKICGILIENSLSGERIDKSVIGIGVNVNQREFTSDAPNPVSMAEIADCEFPLDKLLEEFATRVIQRIDEEDCAEGKSSREEYFATLWRNNGFYPYSTDEGRFTARIVDVDSMGFLTLETETGEKRRFAFKEVKAEDIPSRIR